MRNSRFAQAVAVIAALALAAVVCYLAGASEPSPRPASIERKDSLVWGCPDCNAAIVVSGKATYDDLQVFINNHLETWHPKYRNAGPTSIEQEPVKKALSLWGIRGKKLSGPTSVEQESDRLVDSGYGKSYSRGFKDALTARMFYDLEIQLGAPRRTNGEINKLLCERRGITYDPNQ